MQKTGVQSLGQNDPLEKGMATHSNILAWSLAGYRPWARKAGEGNGIPLQYSCLENPMGGGAW